MGAATGPATKGAAGATVVAAPGAAAGAAGAGKKVPSEKGSKGADSTPPPTKELT